MGIFDRFKKKTSEPEEQPTAAKPSEAEGITPSMDEHEVLVLVQQKFPEAAWEGEKLLVFREYGMRLKAAFGQMSRNHGYFCVQILFIAQHPYFDEELVESCAGIGRTPEEAMQAGTENFCAGVLTFLLAAFRCEGEEMISTEIAGDVHTFRVPCVRAVLHMGARREQPMDLWEVVKSEIPKYLGKKRAYWVKLFATVNGENPTCEVRINGTVYPDLTDVLCKAVLGQEKVDAFGSDKQFLLLIQQPETYTPCPFTKQEVGELTWRAIRAMQEIHDQESHNRVFGEIQAMAKDASLGRELCCFVPEIYSQQVVQFRGNDALQATFPDGRMLMLRKSQLSAYGYIEDAVFQYLQKQHPGKDANLTIMAISSQFATLNKAIYGGSKIENLQFSPLVYAVDEGYVVR